MIFKLAKRVGYLSTKTFLSYYSYIVNYVGKKLRGRIKIQVSSARGTERAGQET